MCLNYGDLHHVSFFSGWFAILSSLEFVPPFPPFPFWKKKQRHKLHEVRLHLLRQMIRTELPEARHALNDLMVKIFSEKFGQKLYDLWRMLKHQTKTSY